MLSAADRLSELLHRPGKFAPDCIGPEVTALAETLRQDPQVLLLENLRFHKEEEGKVKLPETATDEEKKAAMVSNLLVVLCGEQAASPVINAGTLDQ